jgi:hypothetical protein
MTTAFPLKTAFMESLTTRFVEIHIQLGILSVGIFARWWNSVLVNPGATTVTFIPKSL